MTHLSQGNVARARQAGEPEISRGLENVVRFQERRSLSLGAARSEPPPPLPDMERELARLRVATLVGCDWLAASAQQALGSFEPHIVKQVSTLRTTISLPDRLRALIAFVDASVESPRNIRATHLAALRDAGFDLEAIGSVTRVVAAATYEAAFSPK